MEKQNVTGNVHCKQCWHRKQVSNQKTKNEPIVGRDSFQGAGPRKGAELTPWLWIGGTKEVRIRKMILMDIGGFAAIEEGYATRPESENKKMLYSVYLSAIISTPYVQKYP